MNYYIGQQLLFKPYSQFDKEEIVTVEGLRKHGHAKLSNGWVVDEDGIAKGTKRIQGGRVELNGL